MKPRISVLGAGLMGAALVKTFLKQGYTTHVWNRTRSRSERLVEAGAKIAATVEEAVEVSEIIVVNVNNYTSSNLLLRVPAVAERLRGKLIIQLTTGTPKQAREMAEWAEREGIAYLDGAIMVTPDLMGGPNCKVLYSGPAALFETHKAVLASLGGSVVYLGSEFGAASTLDSAILTYYWANVFGIHQAIALCQREGFPLETLTQSLNDMTSFVQGLGRDIVRRIKTNDFKADLATLEICHQSVRLLIEQSKDGGIDHRLFDAFESLFKEAADAGHNHDDLAVLNRFVLAGAYGAAGE